MPTLANRLNEDLREGNRVDQGIGEGGMVSVFPVRYLRHERPVALNVTKPELSAAVGALRFLAELRTTANLQRPHILPLLDPGEADGLVFFTMHHVKGETLRERLTREGHRFLESVRGEPEFRALMDELEPRWEAIVEWEG